MQIRSKSLPCSSKECFACVPFLCQNGHYPCVEISSSCAIMYDNPLIQDHSCLLIIDKTPTVLYGVNTGRTKGISLLPLALARG